MIKMSELIPYGTDHRFGGVLLPSRTDRATARELGGLVRGAQVERAREETGRDLVRGDLRDVKDVYNEWQDVHQGDETLARLTAPLVENYAHGKAEKIRRRAKGF